MKQNKSLMDKFLGWPFVVMVMVVVFALPYIIGHPEMSPIEQCIKAPPENEIYQTLNKFFNAEASGNIEAIREVYSVKARERFDEWVSSRGYEVISRFLQKKHFNVTSAEYGGIGGDGCGDAWVSISFFGKDKELVEQTEYHLSVEEGEWKIAYVLPINKTEVVKMG